MLLIKLIERNNLKKIQQLLDENKVINKNELIWALFIAVEKENKNIIKVLIDAGIDVNNERIIIQRNNSILIEGTVLRDAAESGQTDIVKMLIDAGADTNVVPNNLDEPSALMLAAQEGHLEIVRILVEAGANVNLIREANTYALLSAAGNGHKDVFDYLFPLTSSELQKEASEALLEGIRIRAIEKNADSLVIELTDAVVDEDLDEIKKIIFKGVNVNGFDDGGCTALLAASAINNFEIVKILIEAKADPNIRDLIDNTTPLMRAKCFKISSLLINNGADVNAKDSDGTTILMMKISTLWFSDSLKIISLLVQKGAYINAQDNNGNTAIGMAKKTGNTEIIELLLEAGAKEN